MREYEKEQPEGEQNDLSSKEELKGPIYVKRILLGLLLGLYMIWYIPFAKNELLTLLHGSEFRGRHEDWSMSWGCSVTYMKVVKYHAKEEALVFYAFDDSSCAELYKFVRNKAGDWVFESATCIWSTGSADDFYWPYIFRKSLFIKNS